MREEIFEIDGIMFKIFRHNHTEIQHIDEAKNEGRQLIGTYTYDIHLFDKGKEILSINKISGSSNDGYHGTRIPNEAFKQLKAKFQIGNSQKLKFYNLLNIHI